MLIPYVDNVDFNSKEGIFIVEDNKNDIAYIVLLDENFNFTLHQSSIGTANGLHLCSKCERPEALPKTIEDLDELPSDVLVSFLYLFSYLEKFSEGFFSSISKNLVDVSNKRIANDKN